MKLLKFPLLALLAIAAILTSCEVEDSADVNQDNLITPADFNAWVIAFNSNCP